MFTPAAARAHTRTSTCTHTHTHTHTHKIQARTSDRPWRSAVSLIHKSKITCLLVETQLSTGVNVASPFQRHHVSVKRKMEVLTLEDIEQEYMLVHARLQLLHRDPDAGVARTYTHARTHTTHTQHTHTRCLAISLAVAVFWYPTLRLKMPALVLKSFSHRDFPPHGDSKCQDIEESQDLERVPRSIKGACRYRQVSLFACTCCDVASLQAETARRRRRWRCSSTPECSMLPSTSANCSASR